MFLIKLVILEYYNVDATSVFPSIITNGIKAILVTCVISETLPLIVSPKKGVRDLIGRNRDALDCLDIELN